jgi:type IV secretion system protein VirD4
MTARYQSTVIHCDSWARSHGASNPHRVANIHDAEKAGLLDSAGWYLGVMDRRFLFLNADGHNLIYARTGGGKGTTSALPNLAHCQSSMFVIDVKDAELAKASAAHRALNLGQDVIVLDPWGITGHPSAKVSPLHRLVDAEADEIALILLPPGKADAGDNSWVRKGARRLLSMRMKYLAYEAPHRLRLSELWRFVNASDGQLQAAFADMRGSPREDVAGAAAYMLSVMLEAPKQFEAYRSECIEALASFFPDSSLDRATSENTVDLGMMKERPTTVYLCVPSSKIGVAAPWLAMILNCQSASKRDPLSACNRDPLLGFVMDVTSAPLARVGA